MKRNLVVSEKFYSIQGEGNTMGVPAVFLRLAGCNLLCEGKGWICDTIEVWRKGDKTPYDEVLDGELLEALEKGAHLIITGGEPMLHQRQLVPYLAWFRETHGWIPAIEVETNGTIEPCQELLDQVFLWNVSPKLGNSGESFSRRYKKKVLKLLGSRQNTIFKFVVNNAMQVEEIHEHFADLIAKHQIHLMPAGATQEELAVTKPVVAELCKKHLYRFSDRLHVEIWDQKTGV